MNIPPMEHKMDEPPIKRTVNQYEADFNAARKELFGEEKIPLETNSLGQTTYRPRWTTAGEFIFTKPIIQFSLGPFTYFAENRRFFAKKEGKFMDIGLISTRHFNVESFEHNRDSLKMKFSGMFLKYNLFIQDGKLCFNLLREDSFDVNLKNDDNFLDLVYTNKLIPLEYYPTYDHYTAKNDVIVNFNNLFSILLFKSGEKMKPGKYQRDGYFVSVSIDSIKKSFLGYQCRYKFLASGTLQIDLNEYCIVHEVGNSYLVKKTEVLIRLQAIDWLIHVLSGPDKRSYQSPGYKDIPDNIPYKETLSEPLPNFILKKENGITTVEIPERIYFVTSDQTPMTKAEAQYIYNVTMNFLRRVNNISKGRAEESPDISGFPEVLVIFYSSNLDERIEFYGLRVPYSLRQFKEAQARLDRFVQHEFLGCSLCDKPATGICCSVFYCGETCQATDWSNGHKLECLH